MVYFGWFMISEAETEKPLSKNEGIKSASNFLRGTLLEGLSDQTTGALADDDTQLTKFHGIYQQDDRDVRAERRRQKLDKAYSFMLRVRVPGGIATPAQWLTMDRLSDQRANGTIKLTTRQAFQLHGIIKGNLQPVMRGMHEELMDSIAACGDVNRNVMCNPDPEQSEVHREVYETSKGISLHLLPRSRAYFEIWIDGKLQEGGEPEEEPIYGATYLPRKFKIGVAVPPSNDVDVFSQDLGYIAIVKDGKVVGYNVTVGGGLGTTHGNKETFPRLGDVIGFCRPDQVNAVAEAVVTTQRDYGDRTNRAHARLKYTIEDRGIEWFKAEVESRLGWKFAKAKPYKFDRIADRYGWHKGIGGKWTLTLFIQNGRVRDVEGYPMKTALRKIAEIHTGDFRLTASQNLIVAGITPKQKKVIEGILAENGMENCWEQTGLRLNSLACVALPTCGLALAEAERYLPDLVTALEDVVEEAGLSQQEISIRMTGCPNGCARPYLAEIGLIGRVPGKYNLYLGAKYEGTRLNTLYRESLTHEQIVAELKPILLGYAKDRKKGERFGDYCHRAGLVSVDG